MKIEVLEKYPVGLMLGFLAGFFMLHPLSMVFEGLLFPVMKISPGNLISSFHLEHLPMAVFFGILGMIVGAVNVYYLKTITKKKRQIKLLEGFLPICSYCNKVRDDTGSVRGEGQWERIDSFIYRKTDQEFTHGICPECVDRAFPRIN